MTDQDRVRKVEILISMILRIGVLTSLAVVLAGLAISFVHHPDYLRSPQDLKQVTAPGRTSPHNFHDVVYGIRQGRGEALTMLGLLLLIATPVVRVAVSILAFVYERDPVFVAITAFVLGVLVVSFFLGSVEA